VLLTTLTGALPRLAPTAPPVFASAASAGTPAAATSLTIPAPTGTAAGHVLLAAVAYWVDSTSAITPPAGWSDVLRTSWDSVLCPDRTGTSPFSSFGGAVDPLYVGNAEPDLTDDRCTSLAAALAWAAGVP
jgi:hypothetical protein